MLSERFLLLRLSKKELSVLNALKRGLETPLEISRETGVSRPGVYDIFRSLKKRGIIESKIKNRKKSWHFVSLGTIEKRIFEIKRLLLNIPEGAEGATDMGDSAVIIHRGKEAIRKIVQRMLSEHKSERLYGFQGSAAEIAWERVFTIQETNQFNRAIKKNRLIIEAILPINWFERQIAKLGIKWAKEFEGRATRVNAIDGKYFEHGGQIFVFEKSVYFMALSEETIVEIKNSEIQKMILSIFRFLQDNSRTIDANQILRELIAKESALES